jgi:hypothetical protein
MSDLPKIAFYRGGSINARQGIKPSRTFNPDTDAVESGIILGSRRLRASDKDGNIFTACEGSSVIWPLWGQTLDLEPDGSLLQASIQSSSMTGPNGAEHFLTRYVGDGKCLVLVQTGIQNLRDLRSGKKPIFHGSLPLKDGVREIARWTSTELFPATDIPIKRQTLYELTPGAELFVGDVFHGPFCEMRIVIENGLVQANEPPCYSRGLMEEHGRDLFALASEKRTQRLAA